MPTRKTRALIQEQASNLVQGLVDIMPYPAYIVSKAAGLVAINDKATELVRQGLDTGQVSDDGVSLGDLHYSVVRKNLNHSTDFVLCELHSGDSPTDRIRASTRRLDHVLSEVF